MTEERRASGVHLTLQDGYRVADGGSASAARAVRGARDAMGEAEAGAALGEWLIAQGFEEVDVIALETPRARATPSPRCACSSPAPARWPWPA